MNCGCGSLCNMILESMLKDVKTFYGWLLRAYHQPSSLLNEGPGIADVGYTALSLETSNSTDIERTLRTIDYAPCVWIVWIM